MSIPRANINITFSEAGGYQNTWQWKTGDPAVAVDLTGHAGILVIRKRLVSPTALLTLSSKSGYGLTETGIYFPTQTGDDVGKYTVNVLDEDSLGLCTHHADITGVYNLILYDGDGVPVFEQYGTATIYAATAR